MNQTDHDPKTNMPYRNARSLLAIAVIETFRKSRKAGLEARFELPRYLLLHLFGWLMTGGPPFRRNVWRRALGCIGADVCNAILARSTSTALFWTGQRRSPFSPRKVKTPRRNTKKNLICGSNVHPLSSEWPPS